MYFQLQQMYSCETVGKSVCITRMGAVKLQYKHYNGKKTNRGGGEERGAGVKDMEFSGVLKK